MWRAARRKRHVRGQSVTKFLHLNQVLSASAMAMPRSNVQSPPLLVLSEPWREGNKAWGRCRKQAVGGTHRHAGGGAGSGGIGEEKVGRTLSTAAGGEGRGG